MHFTGIFWQELQSTSHRQKVMASWSESNCLPCLPGISPPPDTRQISLRTGSQSWVRHGNPQRPRSESQHLLNKYLLTLCLTGCNVEPDRGHSPDPLPSLKLGKHHNCCFYITCKDRKEPRGCKINPDNLGQSRDRQVGSGWERKGISGRRNSILKDERENVRCIAYKVVQSC